MLFHLDTCNGVWDIQESCFIKTGKNSCLKLMGEIWSGQTDLKIMRKKIALEVMNANELILE